MLIWTGNLPKRRPIIASFRPMSIGHNGSLLEKMRGLAGRGQGSRLMVKEQRICKYIDEVNAVPVVFKWKYKLDKTVV